MKGNRKLWYRKPADAFTSALPLGNGSLGAMIYGQLPNGYMTLNLDTLWSGTGTKSEVAPEAGTLKKVRQLIFEGKYYEAEQLMEEKMLGFFTESYMPMAKLQYFWGDNFEIEDYKRELDLETGFASAKGRDGEQTYLLKGFASFPDQAMILHYENSGTKKSFIFSLNSELLYETEITEERFRLKGTAPSHVEPIYVECENGVQYEKENPGLLFVTDIYVHSTDGKVFCEKNSLCVQDASYVNLIVMAVSGYRGYKKEPVRSHEELSALLDKREESACAFSYETLMERHLKDYQSLYERMDITLGEGKIKIPTDERLERIRKGEEDPDLYGLFFQYGRYLLIAGSRPGSQATNLQGIWNEDLRPAWSSNYTININTEMNYWPACAVNLAECQEPMHTLIKEMSQRGQETARKQYGCQGWTANHNVDLWRQTNPVGGLPKYAYWPMGGVWMASHLYTYYEYTQDLDFLKETAYPILEGSTRFCLDFLIEGPDGKLHTCPSTSPENVFCDEEERVCSVSYSSTLDITLVREMLTIYLKMAEKIPVDGEIRKQVEKVLMRIPQIQIGSDGCVQEWILPFQEVDLGHRHLTPVYGVHPGNQITPEKTPELAEASRNFLKKRLDNGGGHTGWSCAWLISLFARLYDQESAEKYLKHLLTDSVYINLFDLHPPLNEGFEGEKEVFQIDGNFGAVEGMLNLLLHCHQDEVRLLPTLPKMWPEGEVRGLCARGGFVVDMTWNSYKLTSAVVHSMAGNPLRIVCDVCFEILDAETEEILVEAKEKTAVINTKENGVYIIKILA